MTFGNKRPLLKSRFAAIAQCARVLWVVGTLTVAGVLRAQTPLIVLHDFADPQPRGENANGLIRDRAGNLYGIAESGGIWGYGALFKVPTGGGETVLYSFRGGADGANPVGSLVSDAEGNLYGATHAGGAANAGVVFRLSAAGAETVLYTFTGGVDGGSPPAGVIRDSGGNLYGTTEAGGTANKGVVYKFNPSGEETVLHSFTGRDGEVPMAGLFRDKAGNLYGTTESGGFGLGVVFKPDATGQETTLFRFLEEGTQGDMPSSGVVLDSEGNIYGTTFSGGAFGGVYGYGVVYKLDAEGHETILHSFTGGADGGYPGGSVILDSSGNLYGTTPGGTLGGGVVYKLDPAGNETVLYNFAGGAGGADPNGLIRDAAGNLYGTTSAGGVSNAGLVYELDAAGMETVLYSFPGATNGAAPAGSLTRDSSGNLYGTTSAGGLNGAGTVYRLDPSGKETLLYSFTGGTDGADPQSGVIRDAAGNLYGTTFSGGVNGFGVVYKLDASNMLTVLHSFTGIPDGYNPSGGLIFDASGNLYGTTTLGGTADGGGAIFKIDTRGEETLLYSFVCAPKDIYCDLYPFSGLTLDGAGNLYGTFQSGGPAKSGSVYQLTPTGQLIILHAFAQSQADGYSPYAGVVLDSAGNLYGTTQLGGENNFGVVYEISAAGQETILYTFTGGLDGGHPFGGLLRDQAGNLFGTTPGGGSDGDGVVYKIDPSGVETVLANFTGTNGEYPASSLIFDSAGNLYGTAPGGGNNRVESFLRLRL